MPIPNNGSLNASIGFRGLTDSEATVVLGNLPDGVTATFTVHRPGVGGKRFAIEVDMLTLKDATDIATALSRHCERVANPVADDQATGGSRG
jgi:hypothetical protein